MNVERHVLLNGMRGLAGRKFPGRAGMNPEMEIVNPVHDSGWDDAVFSMRDYSFFHSSAWARVLHESYGYEPVYFALRMGDCLLAMIPMMDVKSALTGRRGVSLPFTDLCEPGVIDGVPFQDLFNRIADFGADRRWRYLEFRGGSRFLYDKSVSASFYGHRLELSSDPDRLYSGLKESVRRNIRKAGAAGVKVSIHDSLSSLHEFYRLHCMTRRLKGLPPPPRHFFEKIHQHVIAPGCGFVALAAVRGAVVAGAVFFRFGEKAIFKYGASDRRFQDLRANDLVMWEAIRHCRLLGCRSLCFGRTEPENDGLRRFKRGWGGQEYPVYYYRYDLRKQTFLSGAGQAMRGMEHLFRRMPLPLLRMAGAILYRHVA